MLQSQTATSSIVNKNVKRMQNMIKLASIAGASVQWTMTREAIDSSPQKIRWQKTNALTASTIGNIFYKKNKKKMVYLLEG